MEDSRGEWFPCLISSQVAPPGYSSYKSITNPLVDAFIRGFLLKAPVALETSPVRAEPPYHGHHGAIVCAGSLSPPPLRPCSLSAPGDPVGPPHPLIESLGQCRCIGLPSELKTSSIGGVITAPGTCHVCPADGHCDGSMNYIAQACRHHH